MTYARLIYYFKMFSTWKYVFSSKVAALFYQSLLWLWYYLSHWKIPTLRVTLFKEELPTLLQKELPTLRVTLFDQNSRGRGNYNAQWTVNLVTGRPTLRVGSPISYKIMFISEFRHSSKKSFFQKTASVIEHLHNKVSLSHWLDLCV